MTKVVGGGVDGRGGKEKRRGRGAIEAEEEAEKVKRQSIFPAKTEVEPKVEPGTRPKLR